MARMHTVWMISSMVEHKYLVAVKQWHDGTESENHFEGFYTGIRKLGFANILFFRWKLLYNYPINEYYRLNFAKKLSQTRPMPSGVSPAVRKIHISSLLKRDLSSLTLAL